MTGFEFLNKVLRLQTKNIQFVEIEHQKSFSKNSQKILDRFW
jgi:hypothetical protein